MLEKLNMYVRTEQRNRKYNVFKANIARHKTFQLLEISVELEIYITETLSIQSNFVLILPGSSSTKMLKMPFTYFYILQKKMLSLFQFSVLVMMSVVSSLVLVMILDFGHKITLTNKNTSKDSIYKEYQSSVERNYPYKRHVFRPKVFSHFDETSELSLRKEPSQLRTGTYLNCVPLVTQRPVASYKS